MRSKRQTRAGCRRLRRVLMLAGGGGGGGRRRENTRILCFRVVFKEGLSHIRRVSAPANRVNVNRARTEIKEYLCTRYVRAGRGPAEKGESVVRE